MATNFIFDYGNTYFIWWSKYFFDSLSINASVSMLHIVKVVWNYSSPTTFSSVLSSRLVKVIICWSFIFQSLPKSKWELFNFLNGPKIFWDRFKSLNVFRYKALLLGSLPFHCLFFIVICCERIDFVTTEVNSMHLNLNTV